MCCSGDIYSGVPRISQVRVRAKLKEDKSLPQLIVLDGGKGQLSSAVKSIELLGLHNQNGDAHQLSADKYKIICITIKNKRTRGGCIKVYKFDVREVVIPFRKRIIFR